MVELIVLTYSSGLSDRLITYVLYLLKQLLGWYNACKTMLCLIESIANGLYVIMTILIPTGL